ncbi:MAG: metallophosphoesterase family protein [bacterium]|nr:metallophosphoesterase family protein [bacterium]
MRVALLSDIHSNYEAFTAVAEDIVSQDVDGICVLGDVVGYGAEPSAVLGAVMAMFGRGGYTLPRDFAELAGMGGAIVVGNHDAAAIGDTIIRRFNPRARAAAEWTAKQIREEEERFITALPITAEFEGATLIHSSPESPADYPYILGAADARLALENSDNDLVFIGHTHKPIVYELGAEIRVLRFDNEVALQTGKRYIVNAGSVGQPRDGDNRAAYVIRDTEGDTLQLRRVEYDIEGAAAKIIAAGLPDELGKRLFIGR